MPIVFCLQDLDILVLQHQKSGVMFHYADFTI